MVGNLAGTIVTSGAFNTFVGNGAGSLVTTDSGVIVLGASGGPTGPVGPTGPGFSNSLWIPPSMSIDGNTGPINNMFIPMYNRTTGQITLGAYFADLYSTVNQYFNAAYTEYLAQFDAPVISSNITLGRSTGATGPLDTVLFPYSGVYEISYNPQYVNTSNTDTTITMYLKTGIGNSSGPTGPLTVLSNSGSNISLSKQSGGVGGTLFPYFSITLAMPTNGCLQYANMITVADGPSTIGAINLGPTGPAPACPSIIANVKRVG
jgi:hypothetical protein